LDRVGVSIRVRHPDLDGDGQAAPQETLRSLDAVAYALRTSLTPILDSDDGEYDVGWDFPTWMRTETASAASASTKVSRKRIPPMAS
jgi:hypothetical protein